MEEVWGSRIEIGDLRRRMEHGESGSLRNKMVTASPRPGLPGAVAMLHARLEQDAIETKESFYESRFPTLFLIEALIRCILEIAL